MDRTTAALPLKATMETLVGGISIGSWPHRKPRRLIMLSKIATSWLTAMALDLPSLSRSMSAVISLSGRNETSYSSAGRMA